MPGDLQAAGRRGPWEPKKRLKKRAVGPEVQELWSFSFRKKVTVISLVHPRQRVPGT